MGSIRLAEASTLAVSLVDAKAHLRIDGTEQDTYITDLIRASIGYVENESCIALLTSKWEFSCPALDDVIELPMAPVSAITSITYMDVNGATQTLSSSLYQLDNSCRPAKIMRVGSATYPETY